MLPSDLSKCMEEINHEISRSFPSLDLKIFEKLSPSEIEEPFFSYNIFSSLAKQLFHIFKQLEMLRGTDHLTPSESQDVQIAWISILAYIHILVTRAHKADLMGDKSLKADFPELEYCRLLRNDFIQHQDIEYPFFSHAISIIKLKNDLPVCMLWPHGYGISAYWKPIEDMISNTAFKGLAHEEKARRNKEEYKECGGWGDRGNIDDQLKFRIKAYGLPPPDQKKLSDELFEMYKSIVMPKLKECAEKLQKTGG